MIKIYTHIQISRPSRNFSADKAFTSVLNTDKVKPVVKRKRICNWDLLYLSRSWCPCACDFDN